MSDVMTFPKTVEEFMEIYKVVDTEGVYMSKGAELVPIFRMRQWFEHLPSADVKSVVRGKWIKNEELSSNHVEPIFLCSNCNNFEAWGFTECYPYCPNCGASMDVGEQDEV